MIKNLLPLAFAAIFMVSCGNNTETKDASKDNHSEKESSNETEAGLTAQFTVNGSESTVHWTAEKLLMAGHHGTFNVSDGSISVENGNITSGNFKIDIASIAVLDEDMEDEKKQYLASHLLGTGKPEQKNDFFNVTDFPTASFKVSSVEKGTETSHIVKGELTLKDKTKTIEIPMNVSMNENQLSAKGTVSINRTEWGIKYNSKGFFENISDDYVIKDDVALEVSLNATASEI